MPLSWDFMCFTSHFSTKTGFGTCYVSKANRIEKGKTIGG
jgi:hypothetical protein